MEDQSLEGITMEELSEELPETAPRFVLLQFEYHSIDGRIAYPHVFVYYSPPSMHLIS